MSVSRMEKLHTLWLQRNHLETLPENICRMTNLETLVVSGNRLKDIPAVMEDMSNLRSVSSQKHTHRWRGVHPSVQGIAIHLWFLFVLVHLHLRLHMSSVSLVSDLCLFFGAGL